MNRVSCKNNPCLNIKHTEYNMKRTTRLRDEKMQWVMYIVMQVTGDSVSRSVVT